MRRLVLLLGLFASSWVQAQIFGPSNWQEGPVPEPPEFSVERLLRFEVNPNSPMVYAIDPQTLSISAEDRVVRYVVVASSPSGVRNVFYEGIRCQTAQVKTYARHAEGRWVVAASPQWQEMVLRPSRHALALARQGACENAAPPASAADVLRNLRQGTVPVFR